MFNVDAMARSEADLVLPIPMHRSRLRARGYNQSEIIGREIADRLSVDFRTDVLIRSENTVPQSEQPTAVARRSAMKDSIEVASGSNAPQAVVGKRVLLVDDVFTTGSTVNAAAAALKSAGASWVGAAVLTVQPIGALK